ncbi:hypothetical protein ACOMHN_026860 [Nucella lapillus]
MCVSKGATPGGQGTGEAMTCVSAKELPLEARGLERQCHVCQQRSYPWRPGDWRGNDMCVSKGATPGGQGTGEAMTCVSAKELPLGARGLERQCHVCQQRSYPWRPGDWRGNDMFVSKGATPGGQGTGEAMTCVSAKELPLEARGLERQ